MTDAIDHPAFTIRYLGNTDAYDVYDVAIRAGLVQDSDALIRYKQQVVSNLHQAKSHRRKLWGAVDLSGLATRQLIALAYRCVLPFVREPMIFKVYGVSQLGSLDDNTQMLNWLMRQTFKMNIVANRAAALPLGFADQIEQKIS